MTKRLTRDNLEEVRLDLIESGIQSYAAFDGSGLNYRDTETNDWKLIPWGKEIPNG